MSGVSPPLSIAELRQAAAFGTTQVTSLFASIDDVPLQDLAVVPRTHRCSNTHFRPTTQTRIARICFTSSPVARSTWRGR